MYLAKISSFKAAWVRNFGTAQSPNWGYGSIDYAQRFETAAEAQAALDAICIRGKVIREEEAAIP